LGFYSKRRKTFEDIDKNREKADITKIKTVKTIEAVLFNLFNFHLGKFHFTKISLVFDPSKCLWFLTLQFYFMAHQGE